MFSRPIVGSTILLIGGSLAIMLGMVMLLDVGQPGSDLELSTPLCLMVLGLPFAITGAAWLRTTWNTQQRQRREQIEAKVLRIAKKQNYRVTAPDVAMNTDLSLEEARSYLERLARNGTVAVQLGDNGVLVYCFRDSSV